MTEILREKLLAKEAEPDGIIATTFTNKAAAELKERVHAALLEQGRQDLALSIFEARIGTVNSVCGGLLRRFAFELGLSVEQKVLDEHAAMEHLSRALDTALGSESLAAVTALSRRLGRMDRRTGELLWKDDVKAVIDHARYNHIDPKTFPAFARRNADELFALFPPAAPENLDELVRSEIAGLIPIVETHLSTKPQKNTAAYLDLLRHFDQSLETGRFTWNAWLKMAREKPAKALHKATGPLDDLCRRVASHPGLHRDLRDYLETVFSIAARSLGIYQEQKRRLGFVDFADQESMLLDGLDNPTVTQRLRERLDLLLVDEFQDTSPIQLALFLKLSTLARETYWVGDGKQAIYGFRGGDARLMKAVLDFLPGDGREILGRSWRSVPSLVNAMNAVFGGTFSSSMEPEEIVLQPEREEHPSQPSCFRWELGAGPLEQQYRAVATGIARLLEKPCEVFNKQEHAWRAARHGDIAVLARTNAHVRKIAAVLREHGIPAATEQPGLLATPEALLVTAGLRRLVDPSDTLATAEIYSLVTCAEPEEWLQNRLDHLAGSRDGDLWLETGHDALPALGKIARLRERCAELSPSGALEAVVTATDAVRHALAWCRNADQARMRLSNIQELVRLAREYEQECATDGSPASLRGLLGRFAERVDSEEDLFPEPPLHAVRVLTFHKAKGLEWPVVVLLDLDSRDRTDISRPMAESPGGIDASAPLSDRFIRFWPSPFGGKEPFGDLEAVARSNVMQEAVEQSRDESARLLYVAMTRARDCLVLGASSKSASFPWLEQAGAECFVKGSGDVVTLPDGSTLRCERWDDLDDETPVPQAGIERASLFWYAPREPVPERLPEQLSPSLREAAPEVTVTETVRYGSTLKLHGAPDPMEKGTVIHGILAFSLSQRPGTCDAASVAELLERHAMAGLCEPESIARQLGEFRRTLSERWPDGTLHVEVPVEQLLHRAQVLKGQIDLVLETPDGWVIIDHKITVIGQNLWSAKALEYSGQLLEYKQALEAVTGKPVESCWINLFASGGLVRLDV
ncbi:UvrD-helicase domain-containing protein [Prosthecochloris sp. GSB1]|uniref:UvrD-helicase domain-containing protein n=1 Tax=Prosthecochloris sp. GSB1 TaxID=281093 RepID=UPI001EEDA284|nr:UvrD-helicase domain-containing protein [Prosthecochloris sp. GSB1]